MFLSHFAKSVLLVISISCVSNAYITPGNLNDPVQYQPGLGGGDNGGWVDPGSGADSSPYDPQPTNPNQPGYIDHDVRSIWMQRNVTNEQLDLRALARLDSSYQGWEVIAVRANVQPNNQGRTIVQLVADGRIIATQINPGYQIYLTPLMRAILGATIHSLQLVVNGSTFINNIQIDLQRSNQAPPPNYPPPPPNYPPPPPPPYEPPPYPGNPGQQQVVINVYANLYGNDRVDLTRYFDLSLYRGFAINAVMVEGRSVSSSAINLLINGINMGQAYFSGNYPQSQSLWLSQRPVIGRGADSIVLYSSGQMTVERVTLVLSR